MPKSETTTSRKLRVLYVDQNSGIGGGQLALLRLLKDIDRHLVEPIVVLGRPGAIEQDIRQVATTYLIPLDDQILNLTWERQGWLMPLLTLRASLRILRYILALRRLIRQNHIDVIHGNSMKACLMAGIAGRLSAIPVIWHMRTRIDKDSLIVPAVLVGRFLLRILPNFVIANSHATLGTLRLPASKARRVIYSSIDVDALQEAVRQGCGSIESAIQSSEHIRFGVVGRLDTWKGQDVFIQAAAAVHKIYPRTKFFVIGSAPDTDEAIAYEARLRTLAQRLQLTDDVLLFTGFQKDVNRAIAGLHVIVTPSTKPEPMGQATAQALLAGKVIIASEGGGTPELVSHGKTGFITTIGSPESLADAMLKVLSDPTAAQTMAERGKHQLLRMFRPANIARQIEDIYCTLTNRNATEMRRLGNPPPLSAGNS